MIDFSKLPPECDVLCEWRDCLHRGENKGPYSPGRGYTGYYPEPEYVCMTRMQQGCPLEYGTRPAVSSSCVAASLRGESEPIKMSLKARRALYRQLDVMLNVARVLEERVRYLEEMVERKEVENETLRRPES